MLKRVTAWKLQAITWWTQAKKTSSCIDPRCNFESAKNKAQSMNFKQTSYIVKNFYKQTLLCFPQVICKLEKLAPLAFFFFFFLLGMVHPCSGYVQTGMPVESNGKKHRLRADLFLFWKFLRPPYFAPPSYNHACMLWFIHVDSFLNYLCITSF